MMPRTFARGLIVGALSLGLGAGCAERANRHRDDATKEPPAMDDVLRNLARNPATTVTVQQGTEHFDDGQVTLTVRGDGTIEVEQRRSGAVTRHAGQLPVARIEALGAQLADLQLTRPRTTTLPRQPGHTPLVLRVEGGAARSFRADLWYGDRYQDRQLDGIIRLADALIHEVSGGALGQPAR